MPHARCWLFLIFVFGVFHPAYSAEPRQSPLPEEKARTLMVLHQPVVMLQAKIGYSTPEERVRRIQSALRNLSDEDVRHPVEVKAIRRYNQDCRLFTINGKPFMLLADQDLDEGDDLSLDQATLLVQKRLNSLRLALIQQYSPHYLLLSTLKGIGGLAILILLNRLSFSAWRWTKRYFDSRILQQKGIIPHAWRGLLGNIEARVVGTLLTLLGMALFYIWLSWLFRLFPYTRLWGESLGAYSVNVLEQIGLAIITAMPGLVIVAIIVLITVFILKLLRILLHQVETEKLHLPGIHPETVSATRKLISVAIWLFALSAAYPFLPGANSLAFKGVSVFFGLLLTLGSAGVMNHAMSGLVLIYSRALRRGDMIRIGENEGTVSEIGMLATKILTRENYIVTVPNAVAVSGKITNLSAFRRDAGITVTTSVTIGYDTPWRQVHALLELAASQTPGINQSVAPVVRQLNLKDWYVEYELQVALEKGAVMPAVKSVLHAQIQDVFNTFGVQIMSPNFIAQPETPVVVLPEHWHNAPARPANENSSPANPEIT